MPSFDIIRESNPVETYRVASVIGAFDLDIKKINEHFLGNIDIEDKEWNVGLIVGGSGTGKSTIAKEIYGDGYFFYNEYKAQSVIDDMPEGKSIKEITMAFTSVGFSSPPSWLKPYAVLSNGEKMRCDLALCLLKDDPVFVFDEFTSVVNRGVAKTASFAIQKAVRKKGRKFVAVSCHSDVIEWLQPDWIYNTDEQRFFFAPASTKGQKSKLTYLGLGTRIRNEFGKYSGNITI